MEFWQTAQVEGDPPRYETRTDAVVVFDEGMHVVVRANDSYSESLLIEGGRQYQRDSADGAWEMHPSSFDRSNMATLDSNRHFRIIDDLTQSTIVGEESLRGMPVTKITGRFDMEARAESIWGDLNEQDASLREASSDPRAQMVAGSEEFVAWVGVDSGMIHAYEVRGSYPAVGELLSLEFWYRVDFSDFNEALELPSVD